MSKPSQFVHGRRRFTCLSPTLVRMEFAPDGRFEDRPSLVAHAPRRPRAFASVQRKQDAVTLDAGGLKVISREPDCEFEVGNLEVQWIYDGLLQYWRPGDRDFRNLGGTIRCLDCYSNLLPLEGVHPADMESPDAHALAWLSWLKCEDDPPYYAQSPDRRPGLNTDFFASVRHDLHQVLARTHNRVLEGLKYGPGLLSRSGYFFLNDSRSPVMDADDFPVARRRPGCQDWYFFAYGADYHQALSDFMLLSGPAPLPTRRTFGLMFCRWPAPDHAEAKQIVGEFQRHGVPLSTLILDMEWHREGWGHWDWDSKFFPDPAGFIRWCHEQGLQVSLNDHPNDVREDDSHFHDYLRAAGSKARVRRDTYNGKELAMVDIDMGVKREAAAFLDTCHRPVLKTGVDFWWNDGNKGRLSGTTSQLICSHLCFNEVRSDGNRGMLLGRYGGLGAHRYGVFFTGDALSCWQNLRTQCEFNIRAGHLGLAYVSHDIGGFFLRTAAPLTDPQLYVRWVQFGVFNPMFRLHSAPGSGSRKPWDYGEKICAIATRWLRVRNSLVPYLYTAARAHHDTGVPLVRGLFLDDPGNEAAHRFDQYAFGPDLVVAPMLSPEPFRAVYLPPGDWYRFETADRVAGGREFTEQMGDDGIPVYVRAGAVLVRQDPESAPDAAHVGRLWLDVYPGPAGGAELYEDDGISPRYERGESCRTRFTLAPVADGFRLSGRVVEGRPLGGQRVITVTVSLPAAPASVRLDGRRTLSCEPAGPGRWRVVLPELPSARAWQLAFRTSP